MSWAIASEPLHFKGGVGVGSVGFRGVAFAAKPHPAATRQQAAKSRCPSPEGEGFG